jgi:hypothetical protein
MGALQQANTNTLAPTPSSASFQHDPVKPPASAAKGTPAGPRARGGSFAGDKENLVIGACVCVWLCWS